MPPPPLASAHTAPPFFPRLPLHHFAALFNTLKRDQRLTPTHLAMQPRTSSVRLTRRTLTTAPPTAPPTVLTTVPPTVPRTASSMSSLWPLSTASLCSPSPRRPTAPSPGCSRSDRSYSSEIFPTACELRPARAPLPAPPLAPLHSRRAGPPARPPTRPLTANPPDHSPTTPPAAPSTGTACTSPSCIGTGTCAAGASSVCSGHPSPSGRRS